MILRICFILLIVYGAYQAWGSREVSHGPGVLATEEPRQHEVSKAISDISKGTYLMKPLATFAIKARVLSVETYSLDRGAKLSPVDLVLGWGRMSDSAVLKTITITQGGRFYYWHVNEFPIPREEIETHSANMHMVPANTEIENRLKALRVGQIISLSGYLVHIRDKDGWEWKSSLTRSDTGQGACEIVWVEQLRVI